MSSSGINELLKHFNDLNIKLDQSSDSDSDETSKKKKNVKNVVAKLDEQGILYPNKANQLKTLFENPFYLAASKLSGPIHLNQKYASTFADTLQTDQLGATKGRFNDSFSVTPSHEMPEGRFSKQDNWQNMNIVNVINTRLGLVCYVRSGKKREENFLTQLFKLPNFNSTENPQLIYSKVIKRQGYKKLFLTFIDDTHLVMCYNKTLEVIDINSTEVVRGHRLCAAAKTMVVEEGEIFVIVGDSSEVLVFSPELEEVEKLMFNFKDWKYPADMKVTPERVFIICKIRPQDHDSPYHWPDRAISFLREDGEMKGEFIFPGNRYTDPISIAAHKESEFVGVLWSKTVQHPKLRSRSETEYMVSLHTLSGSCVFLLDVKCSHSIQILNKDIMIVINQTDGLKYYNMAHFFTYNTLAVRLSSLVTLPECIGLQNFFGITDDEMNRQDSAISHNQNLSSIGRRFMNLMKILEEKGFVGPNNFDDFVAAYDKVQSNLIWDHVDSYVKFQGITQRASFEAVPSVQSHGQVTQEGSGKSLDSSSHQSENIAAQLQLPYLGESHQQLQPAEFSTQQSQHQSLEQTKQPAQHSLQHGEKYAGAFQSELVDEQHPAVVQQTQQTAHQLPASRQQSQLQHSYQQQWHQEQLGYNKRLQYQQLVGYTSQPSCSHQVDMHLPQQVTSPQSCSYPVAFSPQQVPQGNLHNQQQTPYGSQIVNQLPTATSVANPWQQQQLALSYLQQHHDEQVLGQKEQQPTSYQAQKSYQHQEVSPSRKAFFRNAEHITDRQEITLPSFPQPDLGEVQHHSVAGHVSAVEGSFIMDKKSLFVQCLKRKILHLSETRNFTPWGKFFRWKSTDLFVSCWLTLIDRNSMTSAKDTDGQLKLKYTEIFTHDVLKSETRIAIQGGPGSGKTMLLSQLALDWCKGKLRDVAVLVYLPLKTVNDKPLIQAIKNFYIPENTAISETDIESILASDAETVCLLLDGLEGYRLGGTMGAKQSTDVRRILKKEAFPYCKVVVTSHSYFIQDIFDGSLLKVGEFGETERNSYIEKLSQGNIKREEKLKQLIEDDSFLLGLFNVPLFFSLALENIESMGLASDSPFDKVTPFLQNIVETLFLSSMSGPETWSESEQLTLGEIAFNGLCKELKQASWSSNFIETKTSRLKHWLDCRILAVEQTLTEQPWKEYQDTDENDERPKRENMEHVTEQIGLQTYKHGGGIDKETSQSLGKDETEQHARYVKETEIQSYKATVRIKFLHELCQELFAAMYLCSMVNHYTDEDQFHEYVVKQLQKLNPEDLHYVLRFTSYLHPRSCSVIINYLLTNFLPKDGSIPSHIMDCIFLCFVEHNGTKEHDIKNSITEVCKEVITIYYEDGRFLQKAKTSLLQYASACGITIEEVRLDNVISAVDDTFLTFNSGTKFEPLDTLQLIEMSHEDQFFHQDDFGNILKHFSRGNSIKTILCIFPCRPPKIVDDLIIENVKLKNIEVEWNNGEVIWTLDPNKQIFLPVYDTMTKAGHFELKSTEYDLKAHGHFPMSVPPTSLKSFDKWPTKRPLNKLTHSDVKLDVKAKRLKANWNQKVKNESEYKKEQDEEEILDLSKNKPSTSYHRENKLKEEGPSQDVSTMKIKEETCWSDSEQDIWTVKGEPSSIYGERKIVKTGSSLMNSAPSLIKQEISESDPAQDVLTVNPGETNDQSQLSSEVTLDKMSLMAIPSTSKFPMGKGPVEEQLDEEEPSTSYGERKIVKIGSPSMDSALSFIKEEISKSDSELDVWEVNMEEMHDQSHHKNESEVALDESSVTAVPSTSKSPMARRPVEEHLDKHLAITRPTEVDADLQRLLVTETRISTSGGMLQIPNTCIYLIVPPNAIPEDMEECQIKMRVVLDRSEENKEIYFASNSSAVVELSGNVKFRRLVKLTIPHCLVLKEGNCCAAQIFLSHHERGCPPLWEEQTNVLHQLEDTCCSILLDHFCWVKYSTNEKTVTAKKIVVYAAGKQLHPEDEAAFVEVGYYPDLPCENSKFLQRNPSFNLVCKKAFFFRKKGRYPLKFSLNKILPDGWHCSELEKEIPFETIASSKEHSFVFRLQKKRQEASIPFCIPSCIFTASQKNGQTPIDLAVHLQFIKNSPPSTPMTMYDCVFREAEATISSKGGTFEIDNTNVVLEVPPDGLPENIERCVIKMRIIPRRIMDDEVTSFCSNSSVAVELFPVCASDMNFKLPVKLKLPHCLELCKKEDRAVEISARNHGRAGSKWEVQSNLKHRLEDEHCVIDLFIDRLCSFKYTVNNDIVIGKKIIVYTASRTDTGDNSITEVDVGFYPDMPGGGELMRMNPSLHVSYRKILYYKQTEKSPLLLSLHDVFPLDWKCSFPDGCQRPREIPFRMIAWSVEHSHLYILQNMSTTSTNPSCQVIASQANGDLPIELVVDVYQQKMAVDTSGRKMNELVGETFLDIFMVLKRNLATRWRDFGRYLKVPEGKLSAIRLQYSNDLEEGIYQMLLYWSESMGSEATVSKLLKALKGVERSDLVVKIEKIISAAD